MKMFKLGVTCNQADEMVAFIANDDAPKQWCSICSNLVNPKDMYYACAKAEKDCDYRCCWKCFSGIRTYE